VVRETQFGAQCHGRPRDCKRRVPVNEPLGNREGDKVHRPASQETSHALDFNLPVGCDGDRRMNMTTKTLSNAGVDTQLFGIAAAALVGVFLLAAAGFAQASVLHNGAHDTRHAVAFPCH
jgi:cobalt transporter subunit CbtB